MRASLTLLLYLKPTSQEKLQTPSRCSTYVRWYSSLTFCKANRICYVFSTPPATQHISLLVTHLNLWFFSCVCLSAKNTKTYNSVTCWNHTRFPLATQKSVSNVLTAEETNTLFTNTVWSCIACHLDILNSKVKQLFLFPGYIQT